LRRPKPSGNAPDNEISNGCAFVQPILPLLQKGTIMFLRNLCIGTCLVTLIGGHSVAQEEPSDISAPSAPAIAIAPLDPFAAEQEIMLEHPDIVPFSAIAGLGSTNVRNAQLFYRGNRAGQELEKAMEKYRQSEADSDARDEAKDEIQEALGKQYDAYLKGQEKQLDAMEKKLVELKEQLKQRSAAKQKMVDLKFEMVLAQLEGLGWPEADRGWLGTTIGGERYDMAVERSLNLLPTEPGTAVESLPRAPAPELRKSRSTSPRSRGGR
jgi:hypothetical protein